MYKRIVKLKEDNTGEWVIEYRGLYETDSMMPEPHHTKEVAVWMLTKAGYQFIRQGALPGYEFWGLPDS